MNYLSSSQLIEYKDFQVNRAASRSAVVLLSAGVLMNSAFAASVKEKSTVLGSEVAIKQYCIPPGGPRLRELFVSLSELPPFSLSAIWKEKILFKNSHMITMGFISTE